jgi:hypothetical protein
VGVLLDVGFDPVQLEESALPGDGAGATGHQQGPVDVEENGLDQSARSV